MKGSDEGPMLETSPFSSISTFINTFDENKFYCNVGLHYYTLLTFQIQPLTSKPSDNSINTVTVNYALFGF